MEQLQGRKFYLHLNLEQGTLSVETNKQRHTWSLKVKIFICHYIEQWKMISISSKKVKILGFQEDSSAHAAMWVPFVFNTQEAAVNKCRGQGLSKS